MSKSRPGSLTTAAAAEVMGGRVTVEIGHPAAARLANNRPIDPVMLLHQERVETFRLFARLIRRAVRAVAAHVNLQ